MQEGLAPGLDHLSCWGVKGQTCKVDLPGGPTEFGSIVVKFYLFESSEDKENKEEVEETNG